jgi:nucleoside-diphosphate-sugar epimerase
MKVLLVGGSGLVGTCITPYLRRRHEIRVLDVKPPSQDVEFVEGSIDDPEALRRALDGVDSFVTVVMKSGMGGFDRAHTVQQTVDNYTVNCLGLHLLLLTAQEMGVTTGIHTGTMSAHNRAREHYCAEHSVPLDGPNVYGLTKALSEEICRYFAREFGMNEEDLANAYLAGLDFVQHGTSRFESFFIAGDERHEIINISKAEALLGWRPRAHELLAHELLEDDTDG